MSFVALFNCPVLVLQLQFLLATHSPNLANYQMLKPFYFLPILSNAPSFGFQYNAEESFLIHSHLVPPLIWESFGKSSPH